jgi:hypothetical protein
VEEGNKKREFVRSRRVYDRWIGVGSKMQTSNL